VDSWGRSANGLERDFSNAVSGSLLSTIPSSTLNEFRFQFAREDRPRPYTGPDIAGQSRPFPDTAFDFVSGYRFRRALLLSGRDMTRASSSTTADLVHPRTPHVQGRRREFNPA
jgi:hypothetical protein